MTLGFYHSTQNSDSFALPTFGFNANYLDNILNKLKLVYSIYLIILEYYSNILASGSIAFIYVCEDKTWNLFESIFWILWTPL